MKFKQHPEYQAGIRAWQRYYDFYEGDNETLKNYLVQYEIEKTTDGKNAYAQRRARSFYVNFCEPIISIWISLLFKQRPDISGVEGLFTEDELSDIDGLSENNTLEVFIKDFTRNYLQYGKAFMFVDAPPSESKNRTEDQATGWRPYGELWTPLAVPDWERETINGVNRGKFNAMHHQFIRIPPRVDLTHQPRMQVCRRQLKFKNGVYSTGLFKAQPEKDSDSLNTTALWLLGLGGETDWEVLEQEREIEGITEIPVSFLNDRSWLKEVQPLCERYYNLDSNHDNIIYFQGYARVAVAGNQQQAAVMAATEQNFMQFPEGTEITQITAEDPLASEKNRGELRNMIFRVGLNQLRQLDGSSQAVQGAETLREEKENTIALAEETVEEVQSAVDSFVRHWAEFKKRPDFEGRVVLNKKFSSEDYNQFLALYSAFSAQRARYPETSKSLDKKLICYTGLSEEEEKAAEEEIDQAGPEAQAKPQTRDRLLNTIGNVRQVPASGSA